MASESSTSSRMFGLSSSTRPAPQARPAQPLLARRAKAKAKANLKVNTFGTNATPHARLQPILHLTEAFCLPIPLNLSKTLARAYNSRTYNLATQGTSPHLSPHNDNVSE